MDVASTGSNKTNRTSSFVAAGMTNKSQPYGRLRFWLTLLLSGVVIVAFVIFLVAAIEWRSHPFFGAMLSPYMTVDGTVTITEDNWSGLAAGLQRLDHITAINGESLSADPTDYAAARAKFRDIMDSVRPGLMLHISFERPAGADGDITFNNLEACAPVQNGVAACQVSYQAMPLPDNDFLAIFVLPYIIGLITVVIGVAIFYLRPDQPAARLVTVFCLALGVFIGGGFDSNNTYALVPLWLLGTLFIAAPLATLALIFPIRVTAVYRYPWLIFVPAIINVIVAIVAFVVYLNPSTPQSFTTVYQPGLFLGAIGAALLFINLLRRRERAASPTIRDQSNTVLIGLGLTIAPIVFWGLNALAQNMTGQALVAFNTSSILPFFIMPPVTLAYAVLQYRVVDTDKVISQGITYGLLLLGLILGYFLLVFGASLIASSALQMRANDPFMVALTIFVIAVLFLPIRTFLQRRIDQIYFRARSSYQGRVENFARTLTILSEFDQIVASFHKELEEAISPTRVFIFLPNRQTGDYVAYAKPKPETDVRFEADSSMIQLLNNLDEQELISIEPGRPWPQELVTERPRLNILKTMVIIRMRGRKGLVGVVCIGAPRSDKGVYAYEDLRFIENVTTQMALAVERAQVIELLENRVREQEVLSKVSQAINFTIEFDDLLELIYAQTDRLIEASHFYIVLRERNTDKVYYAFFFENDDRQRNKENRRWLMGRDLISEVVRTGLPKRVDDYAAEMGERHSPIVYEDTSMKAWMGVPLIAATNTLGVLVVGTTDADKKYSDEQLKIMGDIGSLAATSLDKARLFVETNIRARQLSALNDISQKLASELNVENLLELITSSAVEILDAEAGSLLLMVEDRQELEFKVAVGSSGQDLVGKRFPAKRGLVGEVATTGQPVIVNDAANDPRWGGEVAKGVFSTTAVLAVPLVAQSQVIGVLEVLNRRSGGIYVKEDADLLTTFAGQAAVAIENARLFEMTDLQLNQRVDELETLEKIDVELNRSLDLKKVADLTMRWAIANSGARAGVLGLVVGEAPSQHLQVISSYGYGQEDTPPGADGMLWPLDRGIVSRVMRTKQPDLSTDVSIDPSYVPSLRASLSQLTIPMLSGGEINALLVLETDTDPRLNLLDMAFAQRLAEHASIAITNAQFYDELTRANEFKSEFVSFVAHELKTPMTSIKGFTDLLLSGVAGQLNDQQSNFLGTIRSNIDRMNTLVSDLNDVTKISDEGVADGVRSHQFQQYHQ